MIVICLLYNFHLFSTHGVGKIEIGKMLEGYRKGDAIDFQFLLNTSADSFFTNNKLAHNSLMLIA